MSANVVRLGAGRGAAAGGENAGDEAPGLKGIRALGYAHEHYHYLSPLTQQIVRLTAAEHGEANLCRLRPLEWWADQYSPADRRQRFDLARACDDLMGACHRVGPYDPELVRGVWWDETH